VATIYTIIYSPLLHENTSTLSSNSNTRRYLNINTPYIHASSIVGYTIVYHLIHLHITTAP